MHADEERGRDPEALLDRLCREVPALAASRPRLAWLVQAVRWGLLPADRFTDESGPGVDNDHARRMLAAVLDASEARAAFARTEWRQAGLRAALLGRLLDLGERPFVVACLAPLPIDEQAELLEALAPAHPPAAVLGAAFPPLKEALVDAARERARGGWTSLLFTVLPLLDGAEREALVAWAVADPTALRGLGDEEVIPLALAGHGRRAVDRASAVEEPYPRAIALSHVACRMPPDHPDRLHLARAQLDLLRLPRSSQPFRRWRNRILEAPVPAELVADVRAVLDAWPPGERAVALFALARHTPALVPEALAALHALRPEEAALGALLHFDLLPEPDRGDAFERGRMLALRWEAQGEQPAMHRAGVLFLENESLDAAGLWTLLAKVAKDRSAALDALANAERCRALDERGALLRIAICAAEALEGEPRATALAETSEAALRVIDLCERLEHLGHLGDTLRGEPRARWLSLLHDAVDAGLPGDLADRVLAEIADLPAPDRDPLLARTIEDARARASEDRVWMLLDLADLVSGELRHELLSTALAHFADGPLIGVYPLFRCLRPEDPWSLHERLIALLSHTRPGMDMAYLCSCLAASQPAERRGPMMERALAAWEQQGLVKFDVGLIPTENLWPLLDLTGARRILALCIARPDDEGTEECLAGLLPELARLGADHVELTAHLALVRTPYLRIAALATLVPGLPSAVVAAQIHAAIEAAAASDEHRHCEILEVVPLLVRLDAAAQAGVIEALERQIEADPAILEGATWAKLFEGLLAIGERARAERWLARVGCCDAAVEGHMKLAACLPEGMPRRAELVAAAEAMGRRLPPDDQGYLHCELEGHEGEIARGWAVDLVRQALDEERMCIRDLMPWMPVARRALGDEGMLRFVRHLCRVR